MLNFSSKARPYFGVLVVTTAVLVLGGVYSAVHMPSAIYPEVTFPRIAIVADKPDFDLRRTELQITVPLEQAVSTVIGVERVRSKTIRGSTELSIDFTPGTDMIRAEQLTWNRIGAARSEMPADVDFTVEQMTPSVFPIMTVVLTGGDNPAQLRDYAFYKMAPEIKKIPDVLRCTVSGGNVREIDVEVQPDKLLAAGLSAADFADQFNKVYRMQPVGRIEQFPNQFQLIVDNQATNTHNVEDVQVPLKNGQSIRVGDVAKVVVGHQDRTNSAGYQGKDAVMLSIFRRLNGNTVSISNDVHNLLADRPPPGKMKAAVAYDQARFITTAVDNVRDAIIIGSVFSILILLAFLRSWRATVISALAIPITLAITFLVLYAIGNTFNVMWLAGLNLMSLGGLAVAIGLIIDDTVVVIENIARHLGHAGHAAAHRPTVDPVDAASSEITGAVVGSTLTTVLVFIPLAFIPGVYGQFFAALSFSLATAVLVSMVISLTIIPVFAAKFLLRHPTPEPGRIYRFLEHRYEQLLNLGLRFPWVGLAASLAAVGVGVLLMTGVPSPKQLKGDQPAQPLVAGIETGLMPNMDEGAFMIDYWAPTGTPLKRTEELAGKIEEILSENPDVEVYVRRSGSENGIFATQTNKGDITVILRPAENDPFHLLTKPLRPPLDKIPPEMLKDKEAIRKKYRRRSMDEIKGEVEDEVHELFSEHQFKIETVPVIQDELNDLSGASRPIEVKLSGPDYSQLRDLAEKVADTIEKKGKGRGAKEVNSNVFGGNPDLPVHVNAQRAARVGLTADDVERQLRVMYTGQVAGQVRESAQRMLDIRVRYPNALRYGVGWFSPSMLREQLLLVPDSTPPDSLVRPLDGPRRAVTLESVADIDTVRNPDEEWRENQQPAIFVTAEIEEKEAGLGSVVNDVRTWVDEMSKEGKIPSGYRWELGGHYLQQQKAFRSLAVVMAVAIMLVFILLAFQFKSVVLPLLIFLTQPLSLVSGLFALWITNTPLNVSSYMGAILLIGLDMKNGILLVEYIQKLRAEGMELRQALVEAGRTRFRPILMTSLAAILGLLPLALGLGPGAQMQQPLAIMVIGGLTANMLFTRVVIPVGYLVVERLRARLT